MTASQITFQKLQIFCTIAEFRSVTRAAEHIGVSQPVVTAHIRSLETKLGVKLFARNGRNIILTEAGERVLRWANDALRQAHEMERDIDGFVGGASGPIAISASHSAVRPRRAALFAPSPACRSLEDARRKHMSDVARKKPGRGNWFNRQKRKEPTISFIQIRMTCCARGRNTSQKVNGSCRKNPELPAEAKTRTRFVRFYQLTVSTSQHCCC